MGQKSDKTRRDWLAAETGTIRKRSQGRLFVALVYPNTYALGMSNLGFQTVYRLFNRLDHVVCERAFHPDSPKTGASPITTVESGRAIGDADIIAFSVSFEKDFPHLLNVLAGAGLPLASCDRGTPHPLVLAGGVACFLNPEPIAEFVDCFLLGEAETNLPAFLERFDPAIDRLSLLETLSREVPGIYVPAFYQPSYHPDGTLARFDPVRDVPSTVQSPVLADLSTESTCSTVLTPHTEFADTYLVEVSRGCPHGCRFCSAGYVYRPPRFRLQDQLSACVAEGARLSGAVGLVGAAVSDLPDLPGLCAMPEASQVRFSFSSLRADALTPALIDTLFKSRVKTATIAPDAGSERMRRVINKGVTEAQILQATEALVTGGIPNLKLYFMVGLPTETDADVAAIGKLCKKVKDRFLAASRPRGRIGTITVSVNPFVPKPVTPFQWAAMFPPAVLRNKIRTIRTALNQVANLRIQAENPKGAYLQALLSRGDRRVATLLRHAHNIGGNWASTFKSAKPPADFFATRPRALHERLPWDFIDHGIDPTFLAEEYRRALAERPSPPCPADTCDVCRRCRRSGNEPKPPA
ncbi:MAG: radical SAM protein [Desulfobacterales bacterium]|nr:radical SAM protein [Desulfobacterales bacterium]